MALGAKRIETRHWSTHYRGPLAIHAAKRWTREEADFARVMGLPDALPLGAIVAFARLHSCIRTEALVATIGRQEEQWGNYSDGRFAWVFQDIVALPAPIPFKGLQGLFDVPDDLFADLGAPILQGRLL